MALEDAWKCVFKTEDFKKLIKALNIKCDDVNEVITSFYFFIDAYPKISNEIISAVWEKLEKEEFEEAGKLSAELGKDLIKREYSLSTMKATAFINGMFLRNNVRAPDNMRESCLEKLETADNIVRFYRRWAKRMEGINEEKALISTVKYLGSEGFKIYEKVGLDFWKCTRECKDNDEFRKVTNYNWDPYDVNFDFDLGTLLGDEKLTKKYLKTMRKLRVMLSGERKYYLFGGLEFGRIVHLASENGNT